MPSKYCAIFDLKEKDYDIFRLIFDHLPNGDYFNIMIKPNWVKHQESPYFPIEAMVTSTKLIEHVIEACLKKYANVREIIVGDVPLQSCEWNLLLKQSCTERLINKYESYRNPYIRIIDLRRERFSVHKGFMEKSGADYGGDPKGYSEVFLDERSFLEPISNSKNKFRVADYDPNETESNHHKGFHRYIVSSSVLDSDLFINMPKMKTHQKAGVTGALKNLVGINGNKACLVHYRNGKPKDGGDEFAPDVPCPIVLQSHIREILQKKSKSLFSALRKVWLVIRKLYGIKVEGTRENLKRTFYLSGGAWYGNDTIWRMIYDLNKIIVYASRKSKYLKDKPQRKYIAILDGMVSGEGNGPLQPLPVETGIVAFSNDPFLLDMAMTKMMGYDYTKIPMLNNFIIYQDNNWANFNPSDVKLTVNDNECFGISSIPTIHEFLPSPGWRGHIKIETSKNVKGKKN